MTAAEKWRLVWKIVATVTPISALIGMVLGYFLGENNAASILAGGVIGALLSLEMTSFEVAWAVGLLPRGWREAPFLVVLFTRSLTWLFMIVVGIGIPLLLIARVSPDELVSGQFGWTVAATFVFAVILNFTLQVSRLLGPGVLSSLLVGRYYRPREETRIFLLVDLRGSSQIAEKLGNLRYHAFLKRFIADISTNGVRYGAEIHRYVGDEVILTWRQHEGAKSGACIKAALAMLDHFESAGPRYLREFGVEPAIWAGMHLGPVVTGEVGTVKHEIVYLGDTLNVAARIEQACRQFQRSFIASAAILDAVQMPKGAMAESLGEVELRGIGSSLELYAIVHTEKG